MKRVSAFTVFQAKKKNKEDTVPYRPPSKSGEKNQLTITSAHSFQSVEKIGKLKDPGTDSGSRGKRFLNALRSGNIRESIRLSSGKKIRPTSLTSTESPFMGLGPLTIKAESSNIVTTPVTRKSPRDLTLHKEVKGTPVLPRISTQTSNTLLGLNRKISTASIKSTKVSEVEPVQNGDQHNNDEKKNLRQDKGQKRKPESETSQTPHKKQKVGSGKNQFKISKIRPSGGASELSYMFDSTAEACKLFDCMIHPVKPDRFFSELWEKKPLLVKRHTPDYNRGWFSTSEFDRILRQENIQWGVNLDATSFIGDKRETHNQTGRAHASVVWDMYQAGCSLRLLNPQTYSRNVWKVLSVLQEYFGCCVGANIYLTPPGTQGFAPHYDDIEAFIIQLEGKKHWKLYSPRTEEEVLARFSSENLSQADVGEPILDTVLEAGDLLYFPRGTIHQGNATDEHSLHITVSCYQLNTWGDLLMKLLPAACQVAMEESSVFREGLPRNYLNYMGIVHSEKNLPERKTFMEKTQSLLSTLMKSLPIDSACDQMGKQLMYDSMPPVLSEAERSCSIHGAGERWDSSLSRVVGVSELVPDTTVKLIRRGALRLLTEEDKVRIYYNVDNARVYRTIGPNFFEITPEMAPAVEHLINVYPEYTSIESLPVENVSDQLNLASMLYERGLLITQEPLEHTYDEPGDEETDDNL
uniref:Bifunctional lysine-specific demethylase and histidyl-hydroxylase n=1 Tax=Arion vulgaris TaxID=1028688 RepID=A0A0B7A3G8_9EUPU